MTMKKILLPLTAALFFGVSATLLFAAEPATGPSGFSATGGTAKSEGKTGETADCPIKKTIGGKTVCFQNDPALTKPQGGN
jgi:hypothetical protein